MWYVYFSRSDISHKDLLLTEACQQGNSKFTEFIMRLTYIQESFYSKLDCDIRCVF